QLALQGRLHLGRVETGQQVDDVHPRDGILALHPADELGDGARIGDLADDAEQGRLLVGLLRVGCGEQVADTEAAFLRRDDIQDRRLGDPGGGEGFDEQVRWIVTVAGEGPGDTGDDSRAAL